MLLAHPVPSKQELKNMYNENPESFFDFVRNNLIEKEETLFEKNCLAEELKLEKARWYGRKSEKTDKQAYAQPSLFPEYDNTDLFNEAEDIQEEIEETTVKKTKRKNLNNRAKSLEIITKEYDLADEEKICPNCGTKMIVIGKQEKVILHYIPAKVVKEIAVTYTYKCPNCEPEGKSFIKESSVPTCFPKIMAGHDFISHIIASKFEKYLPLYRLEKTFNQYGLDITRKTLSNWFLSACNILEKLTNVMYADLLKEDIIHADETTIRVISEKAGKCYMWGLGSSKWSDRNIRLYFYKDSRSHQHAFDLLNTYKGYLQTDMYQAYPKVPNTIDVACFAHAKRKYTEIVKALGKQGIYSDTCQKAIKFINQLYSIEHKLEGKTPEEIYKTRQELAKPIFEQYISWCKKVINEYPAKTAVAKAIQYSINNEKYLANYLLDGKLVIDNNLAERMMKSFVLGRKNFLFCFSEAGAKASSIAYSIVETCIANKIKVEPYLNYVFDKLAIIDIDNELEIRKLLPYSKDLPKELKKSDE